jgi:uncharacterized membrane protein
VNSLRRITTSASDVNLWRIPLRLSLGSVALFALTLVPDVLDAKGIIHLPTWFTMGSIDDARAILGAMLSCVSTVLALIFSVALLVLSMVATLFGPRLLYRFLRDWVTQVTIGLFMGTFVYLCLVFLVTHQDAHSTFVPQVSLITSWLLVVGSFGFLVYYSHRIASSIQNPDLVARIVDDMLPAVRASQPTDEARGDAAPSPEVVARHVEDGAPVTAARSGYFQEIDHAALVAAALREDAVVHVFFRPGQFVLEGEPIACVAPKGRAAVLGPLVRRHIATGRHRTLVQDVEFGIAQIVEIGIRALSPAVNDTFTGVACIDWLGDALVTVAGRPAFNGCWHDGSGKVRVHVRPVKLERLVRMAFDQMRQAAADNPAVLLRLLDTIRRIAPRLPGEGPRAALRDEADAVRELAAARPFATIDRRDIEAAWSRATPALDGPAQSKEALASREDGR